MKPPTALELKALLEREYKGMEVLIIEDYPELIRSYKDDTKIYIQEGK